MTPEQEAALRELCRRYRVPFIADSFRHTFDLPAGWLAGQVGPIFLGVSPDGRISS